MKVYIIWLAVLIALPVFRQRPGLASSSYSSPLIGQSEMTSQSERSLSAGWEEPDIILALLLQPLFTLKILHRNYNMYQLSQNISWLV